MKILSILPESIAGRLIISGLIEGFKSNNIEINVIDELKSPVEEELKLMNISEYDYLLSYDYTAIKLNKDYALNLKTLNYFSDVIESDYSGRSWEKYYNELFNSNTYVFYWDRTLYESLKDKMPNIYYLPLSVNTSVYKNLYLEKEYDIMFAGRLTFENRLNKLLMIEEKFPEARIVIYSYRKHFDQVLELIDESKREKFETFYKGFIETEEDMAIAINKAHIVVNFTSQGVSSLNYRLFETIACETLLLTDYRSELDELFTPGEDVIYYKNDEELLEQIGDYFNDPGKYESIIRAGRSRVEKCFNTKEMTRKMIVGLNRT